MLLPTPTYPPPCRIRLNLHINGIGNVTFISATPETVDLILISVRKLWIRYYSWPFSNLSESYQLYLITGNVYNPIILLSQVSDNAPIYTFLIICSSLQIVVQFYIIHNLHFHYRLCLLAFITFASETSAKLVTGR